MAKRVSIKDKNIAKTNDIDTLFPTSNPQTSDQNGTKKKINVLRKIEDIISYYKNFKGGKQVSIYLPEEIHRMVKMKAAQDDRNMKDVMKDLILDNYLTESEIKEAYRSYIDKLEEDSK